MILVTGGHGFVGTHVVDKLKQRGLEVFAPGHERNHDLLNFDDVRFLFYPEFHSGQTIECVIHLAGVVGGISFNGTYPGRVLYENLTMGMNVVHHATLAGVKKLIMMSSVCAYPKHCAVPFKEHDLWNGEPEETNASYGIAKRTLMALCETYRQQYGLHHLVLIPTNLYGPSDSFDLERCHVIPAMIRRFVEAKDVKANTVVLWGTGHVTRDFLYVEDCAEAIVKAALETQPIHDPMNLGSGVEVRICDLAQMIADLVGWKGQILWDDTKPDGQPRRCLDTSRASKYLGWDATTTLKDGLTRTIDWYVRNRGNLQT